jgi:hypothetical protein
LKRIWASNVGDGRYEAAFCELARSGLAASDDRYVVAVVAPSLHDAVPEIAAAKNEFRHRSLLQSFALAATQRVAGFSASAGDPLGRG